MGGCGRLRGVAVGCALTAGALVAPAPSAGAVSVMAAADDASFTVRVQAGTAVPVALGPPGQVVMGTLTVVDPMAAGHTRVYPCAQGRPNASTSNFVKGARVANFAAVQTDANGYVCFYASATTHLIWDQTLETASVAAHSPMRRLDTQAEGKPIAADAVRALRLGTAGQTIIGNLTVVAAQGTGTVTVYPCAEGRPPTPAISFKVGNTVANGLITKADGRGDVCFYASAKTHLLWDQTAETAALPITATSRLLDTRRGALPAAGSTLRIKAASGRQTVGGNLTAMLSGGPGYLTPYGCADGRPNTSVTAYNPGQTASSYTVVRTDANGELCIYASTAAHVQWDQNLVTSAVIAHPAVRRLETRPRTDSGSYTFASAVGSVPYRWNACVPAVRVAVNWGTASAERANLEVALRRVRDATGVPLVLVGSSSKVPRSDNGYGFAGSPVQADILVAFSQPGATGLLTGKEYGAGGFLNDAFGQRIRRGFAVFDQKQLVKQNQNARITLYMHELGHVMGLGHVATDPTQVMNPQLGTANSSGVWGNGDVSGLRRVGLGAGCLP